MFANCLSPQEKGPILISKQEVVYNTEQGSHRSLVPDRSSVFLDEYISKDGSQVLRKDIFGCKTGKGLFKKIYMLTGQRNNLQLHIS